MFSPVIFILLGLALAFLGRRFVWLIVAAAGFILAYDLVAALLPGEGLLQTLIAIAAGAVAGFFARRFGKLIIRIAGFILLGEVLLVVAGFFGIATFSLGGLIFFVIGGLIGLAILRFAFDNALIIVSALAGGALNAAAFRDLPLSASLTWLPAVIGLAVAVLGFLYQWREFHGKGQPKGAPAVS
jgi:hypothetical protein